MAQMPDGERKSSLRLTVSCLPNGRSLYLPAQRTHTHRAISSGDSRFGIMEGNRAPAVGVGISEK